jgi:transcriptional regulator with GAF, ATPase, and Fis domain
MPNRFRPDPELSLMGPVLLQRVQECGALVDGAWLRSPQSALPRDVITSAFERCGAHEGTIWLLRDGALVPAVNTGPHAAELLDVYRQPIEKGIIGMVAVTEQGFCENDIAQNALRDSTLDHALGEQTVAMMAVPLVFAGGVRGVVSCVQLRSEAAAPGFTPAELETLERDVNVAGRLIDLSLLDSVMGLHGV